MNKEKLWSLDRIEGDYAVLIDDTDACLRVLVRDLPMDACEGRMYRKVGDVYVVDSAAEQVRRDKVRALQNRLRRKK